MDAGSGLSITTDLERVLEPALLVELQEARDVHVQRAAVLARRERQVLAHAGAAALGADVVLELVAEVAHAWSAAGLGARLPQAAERGVADHAAQFVEAVEILLGGARRAVKRFRMRSDLSSPTRHGMHLPQDSEWVNSMK